MLNKKSDCELVKAVQEGCQQSFEELISRYSNKAFSLAARLTRNAEDAEEVLQDVFVTVFRKMKGFEGKSSFSSWLYRITVNAALMKLRKKRQSQNTISVEDIQPQAQEAVLNGSSDQQDSDAIALRHQLISVLEDAIHRLPEDYRPVFILRDIDGLTSREVGRILELSIPAVKSRLHRSRLMLRRRLQKFYKEFSTGIVQNPGKLAGNF
ncbi:MAG: sigma-70 family RNA polymerase sigma factor [Deltaproteobacteria bacterium]|nr:sigma-70 family RNA polymerase sigma factor [Deltaproteobacteria bacterium]